MRTPSLTPAQLIAAAGAIVGALVAFGVLDDVRSQAILAAVSTLVPIALAIADAIVRHGRAQAIAAGARIVGRRGLLLPPVKVDERPLHVSALERAGDRVHRGAVHVVDAGRYRPIRTPSGELSIERADGAGAVLAVEDDGSRP